MPIVLRTHAVAAADRVDWIRIAQSETVTAAAVGVVVVVVAVAVAVALFVAALVADLPEVSAVTTLVLLGAKVVVVVVLVGVTQVTKGRSAPAVAVPVVGRAALPEPLPA